jgi:hypothetical protein
LKYFVIAFFKVRDDRDDDMRLVLVLVVR